MRLPKVLIVSNNTFSNGSNMGRTLAGLFEGWDLECLAQLYFRPERPNSSVCRNYYRFSDIDALKSVLLRCRTGEVITEVEQSPELHKDAGAFSGIYGYAYANRSPALTLGRDLMWKLSAWKSGALKAWIREFSPDVVFYPLGDGVFTYRIVKWIADEFHVPVVTIVYDDFLLGYNDIKGGLHRLKSRLLNKWAHRVIDGAPCLLTTCDMMSRAYEEIFDVPCEAMYSAASEPLPPCPGTAVSYFGNVGLGRWKQLISIGRALQKLGHPGVDVYTQEELPEVLSQLTEENGILFHGSIPYAQVLEKTARSLAVIHTESFDSDMKERVRFSLSTKVADLLASGVCPLVYGPEDVASIDYFRAHEAGCVITREEDLLPMLKRLLEDEAWRRERTEKAVILARRNHEQEQVRGKLRRILTAAAFGEESR